MIDFVLDERGVILAGPPELRSLLGAVDFIAVSSQAVPVVALGGFSATARRVRDPARPWILVRLTVPRATKPLGNLTPRQLEVARLVTLGRSNSEIGLALTCSVSTVRTHLRAVYERLAVSNRVELSLALAHE